ncbi:MAG: hypothetical protein R3F61_14890 [Myxococcota bacterium]
MNAPGVDVRWVPPEHLDTRDALHLRLPATDRHGHLLRIDPTGVSWPHLVGWFTLGFADLVRFSVQWDRLVFHARFGRTELEPLLTGTELAILGTALHEVLERARTGRFPLWSPLEPPPPEPFDPSLVVDPEWIAPWARDRLDDRLHVQFPSAHGPAYLRLRKLDIAWPCDGTLVSTPLHEVTSVRTRGTRIEVTTATGLAWSREAHMSDTARDRLVEALRAFVHRHAAEPEPPPDALLALRRD